MRSKNKVRKHNKADFDMFGDNDAESSVHLT